MFWALAYLAPNGERGYIVLEYNIENMRFIRFLLANISDFAYIFRSNGKI